MESLAYSTSGKFEWIDRQRFARFSRSEYYEAELDCATGQDALDIRVEKGLDAPFFIAATSSKTAFCYQRKLVHIKRDHADICILHYVNSGSLRSLHYGIRSVVLPGQFIIFRSNAPYSLEYEPDESGERAMFYASLPPDFVLRHFSGKPIFGHTLAPPSGRSSIGGELFSLLFERSSDMAPEVANALLSALIKDVARLPLSPDLVEPRETTLREHRLEKIRSYLSLHFTNPDLSAGMLADACKISPRYLSYLLAGADTSFSKLVGQMRMEKARHWLESPWLQDVAINSFAFQVGFKSPSHFIHAFKKCFGLTPGAYRKQHAAIGTDGQDAMVKKDQIDLPAAARPADLS